MKKRLILTLDFPDECEFKSFLEDQGVTSLEELREGWAGDLKECAVKVDSFSITLTDLLEEK